MKFSTDEKTSILLALYVGAILAANLIGGKLTGLFGKGLSVAILALPITYVILSAVNEVFGAEIPRKYVLSAISAQIMVLVLIAVALWLPQGPREIFPGFTGAYNIVFSQSGRIIIGSIVAFLASQLFVIWAFNLIKQKTLGKHSWLRYNLATVSGAFIDTFLFMFIAFFSGDFMFTANIALNYFLFKALASLISTPFYYGAVRWLWSEKTPPREPPVEISVGVPQRSRA